MHDFLDDYDPKVDTFATKFKFGGKLLAFNELEHFTPLFGYDFISLLKTPFCYNNPKLKVYDYIKIFEKKNELSTKTYSTIHDSQGKGYRFHYIDIDLPKHKFLKNKLKNLINRPNLKDDEIPDLYQFEVYTDEDKRRAPRIIGFIGKLGVFYILWLDYDHKTY